MEHINMRCRGVIMHEGKLLLVKHSGGRDFYAFPGGHIDFGEDPVECMHRELVEELGVAPKIGKLLYVHTFITDAHSESIEFFFEITNGADYLAHAEKEKTHAHEIDEVLWAKPSDDLKILPAKLHEYFKEGTLLAKSETEFIRA